MCQVTNEHDSKVRVLVCKALTINSGWDDTSLIPVQRMDEYAGLEDQVAQEPVSPVSQGSVLCQVLAELSA